MLSSLRSELDERQVPLYGILHEELGSGKFKEYLNGELFLDKEVGYWNITISIFIFLPFL